MKILKQFSYLISAMAFAAMPVLIYAPSASANSYFGGNGRLTFYSPNILDDSEEEIYTVNADGSDLQQVTDNSLAEANPQWDPDADAIAFDRYVNGTNSQDIFIQPMNADGSANGSATVVSGANTTEREFDPSWSPDGETIAFHRRSEVGGDGPYHIKSISASGGSVTHLTGIADGSGVDADFADTEPTWSKDGDYVVFTRRDTGDDTSNIAIVPSDGDESDVVIVDSAGVAAPQWSPVGNKIVYSKGGNLVVADLGTDISAVTGPSDVTTEVIVEDHTGSAPTWSPDGTLIATSNGSGMFYYSVSSGELVHSVDVSDIAEVESTGIHELDWARAEAPNDSTHECTIYVNETCNDDDFDPEIPDLCASGTAASVINTPDEGTASSSSGEFTYKPDKDYVGEDQYVYQYYDENMNAITCTVDITVLPKAPDTGAPTDNKGMLIGAILAGGALISGYVYKKKRFARR